MLIAISMMLYASCKKAGFNFSGHDQDVVIYMSQSAAGDFKDAIVHQRTPIQGDSIYRFPLTASFAGSGFIKAPKDIPVTFMLDYSKFDSLNRLQLAEGKPLYEKLPNDVLSFTEQKSVIKSGQMYSEDLYFDISAKTLTGGHNYMVPITLVSADGFSLNKSKTTTYFLIKQTAPVELNRKDWTIVETNSEETVGEGSNNGRAKFVLDGNKATFWHTKYVGGAEPLPHHITIDMKASQRLLGLNITGRQGSDNGNPNIVVVELSEDGNTWNPAINFELDNVQSTQVRYFSTLQSGRYLRFTVKVTMGNTPFTYLSELAAF